MTVAERLFAKADADTRMILNEYTSAVRTDSLAELHLDIVSGCNLRCVMCDWESRIPRNQVMPPGVFADIASTCSGLGVKRLHIGVCGEPSIHPAFPWLVEVTKEYSFGVMITTNLSMPLTPDMKAALQSVNRLIVSCDAATAQIYERIRCGGSFNRFLANLRELCDTKPSDQHIWANVLVLNENISELTDILDLLSGFGVSRIRISLPNLRTGDRLASLSLSNSQIDDLIYMFDHIDSQPDLSNRISHPLTNLPRNSSVIDGFKKAISFGRSWFLFSPFDEKCQLVRCSVYVNAAGLVFPCFLLSDRNDSCFGDIIHGTLESIVRSNTRREWLSQFEPNKCKTCVFCPCTNLNHIVSLMHRREENGETLSS